MIFLVIAWVFAGLIFTIHQKQKQLLIEREYRLQYQAKTRRLLTAFRSTEPFFACPACAQVSYNLGDIENGWCNVCHKQTCAAYAMEGR